MIILEHRQWNKIDWAKFIHEMEKKEIYTPPVLTPQGLDKMLHEMYACINQALDRTCPTAQTYVVSKGIPWFTEALKEKPKHILNAMKSGNYIKAQALRKNINHIIKTIGSIVIN